MPGFGMIVRPNAAEYFAQLTSERKVVRYSRGQPIVRFERKENDLRMTARPPKPVVREQEPSLWDQSERDWWGKRDIWAR